ncbi:hypothetical protein OAC11_05600 [Alphaproteobacteria bacterium]|nr:hypothetical protein [Alphaproteobacteria bacterium]
MLNSSILLIADNMVATISPIGVDGKSSERPLIYKDKIWQEDINLCSKLE